MTLSDKALTTVALVESELGLSSGADSRIEGWIEDASEMIADYLGRVLEKATVTETHAGDGSSFLVLRRPPLASITSVSYDTAALDTDDYEIHDAESGEVRFAQALANTGALLEGVNRNLDPATGERLYSVVYVGGYVTAGQSAGSGVYTGATVTVPRAIRRACIETVTYLRAKAGRDVTVRSESMTGYSVSFGDVDTSGLPVSVCRVLDGFRLVSFA